MTATSISVLDQTTDTDLIAAAHDLATKAHDGQKFPREWSTESRISHCAETVDILREHGVSDPTILAAAWLHDALEDTSLTLNEIEATCGKEVGRIVWACTGAGKGRDAYLLEMYRRIAQVEHAATIKVAARLANMRRGIRTPPSVYGTSSLLQEYPREWREFYSTVAQTAASQGCSPGLIQALSNVMSYHRHAFGHHVEELRKRGEEVFSCSQREPESGGRWVYAGWMGYSHTPWELLRGLAMRLAEVGVRVGVLQKEGSGDYYVWTPDPPAIEPVGVGTVEQP